VAQLSDFYDSHQGILVGLTVIGEVVSGGILYATTDIAASAVAFIGMIICMQLAYMACRLESKWLMSLVLTFYVLHLTLCILELTVAGLMPPFIIWSREVYYAILLLWTLVLLYYCVRARLNFGKGLKPYFDQMYGKAVLDKPRYVDLEDGEVGQESMSSHV